MAKIFANEASREGFITTEGASYDKSLDRIAGQPLDKKEVWDDLEKLKVYAKSVYAYVGQKVSYIDENNKVKHFYIDANGELKPLGGNVAFFTSLEGEDDSAKTLITAETTGKYGEKDYYYGQKVTIYDTDSTLSEYIIVGDSTKITLKRIDQNCLYFESQEAAENTIANAGQNNGTSPYYFGQIIQVYDPDNKKVKLFTIVPKDNSGTATLQEIAPELSAKRIIFDTDFEFTEPFGKFTKKDENSLTYKIHSSGKSLEWLLNQAFVDLVKSIGRDESEYLTYLGLIKGAAYDSNDTNYYFQPISGDWGGVVYRSIKSSPLTDAEQNAVPRNTAAYFCTKIFTKGTMLPVGSVIVLEEGWKFTPVKWKNKEQNTEDYPVFCNDKYTKITEEWWGDNTMCAFNITKNNFTANNTDNPIISETVEDIINAFKVYVPYDSENDPDDEIRLNNNLENSEFEPEPTNPAFREDNSEKIYITIDGQTYIRLDMVNSNDIVTHNEIEYIALTNNFTDDTTYTETANSSSYYPYIYTDMNNGMGWNLPAYYNEKTNGFNENKLGYQNYVSTRIFDRASLPENSLLSCDNKFKYRVIYISEDKDSSTRSDYSFASGYVSIDSLWNENYPNIAFTFQPQSNNNFNNNLLSAFSGIDDNTEISDTETRKERIKTIIDTYVDDYIKIYVPKSSVQPE